MLSACRSEQVSHDAGLRLSLSRDTLLFDTVFSGIGSSTYRVMVRNRNENALILSRVWLEEGRYFHVNIDGETDLRQLSDMKIRGGDSLFVFVRVMDDRLAADAPGNTALVSDALHFLTNGDTTTLHMEAVSQEVILLRSDSGYQAFSGSYTFHSDKPYLIYDTLYFGGRLLFEPGATLYMHRGAMLIAYGDVEAQGTAEHPVSLMGDRRDHLFDSVPYSYAAGQWEGFYIVQPDGLRANSYHLNHMHVLSANTGIYALGGEVRTMPVLVMNDCRIHNHAGVGVSIRNMNSRLTRCELSNAANYCLYLSGGEHLVDHTTIASYYNHTNVRIQNTQKEDVAALCITDLDKDYAYTRFTISNSIVAGGRKNELYIASPLPQFMTGEIHHSYIQGDTLPEQLAHDCVYAQRNDTVFVNTYYEYKVYDYYDYHLAEHSPARGIAVDSLDAGCY